MPAGIVTVWLATVVLATIGQLAFKSAAAHGGRTSGVAHWRAMARLPRLWLGITCYVFEFLCWTAFLSWVPLGQGVLLGSINIVVIMLAARWLFDERLTRSRLIGIALVCAGVAIVGSGR